MPTNSGTEAVKGTTRKQPPSEKVVPKKVSKSWEPFVRQTVVTGTEMSKNVQAGRLKHHIKVWQPLTSDENIRREIRGVSIEFTNKPIQIEWLKPYALPH